MNGDAMNDILRGLRELQGVHGAFVADSGGQVIAFDAESIYDLTLLNDVCRVVVSAIDSIKLLHEDWDVLSTQFSEGRLDVRNLSDGPQSKSAGMMLIVIADANVSASFASVAVRVAVGKLRKVLSGVGMGASSLGQSGPGSGYSVQGPGYAAPNSALSSSQMAIASGRSSALPEVATSGLSWSGFGPNSTMSGSGVAVADAASSSALTVCTKALAKSVGPMAKVFVKEAVRRICPDHPFSTAQLPALIAELEKQIDDPSDAQQFRRAVTNKR
jgi:hypothetical protein